MTVENADTALGELPLTQLWRMMRECGEGPLQRFSQKSAGSHSSSSLSEIITALPIQSLSHSPLSSLYYTVFYSIFNSSLPTFLCSAMVPASLFFLFVLAHPSCLLPFPTLLLLFSSSFILPSHPLAPWVGAMQSARAKDTCGTG